MTRSIRSVLIANRGEIAVRIAKTLQRLGIRILMLDSPLDRGAYHTRFADQVLQLSGETIRETYLNVEQILGLAKQAGADAIHPGYGFLSENEAFAAACEVAGIIFIGPSAVSIAAMGSKANSKNLMIRAGVPTIPGYQGEDQAPSTLSAEAKKIGFPVLLKASAGGGGKGMRVVKSEAELNQAIVSAQSEAAKSFGDDRLIVEKYVENPRHIEMQIFGDAHGHLIHLGERECSVQRRHQKIIEESPSPFLMPETRKKMAAAAVACGKALSYKNAGTVEFVVDDKGNFYFLEVNTRLQVEHPVTECRTGLDLVEWQVRVAQGEPLPLTQDEIVFRGHALEARLYAEDPENGFLPSTGKILHYEEPTAPFLRIDSGLSDSGEVGMNFDPMVSKVIASGATRGEAVSRLIWALENYPVLGVKTNAAFLLDVLRHPEFLAGRATTHFIADHFPDWKCVPDAATLNWLAQTLMAAPHTVSPADSTDGTALAADVWRNIPSFRIGA